jgi:hypothetical protein
LKRQYPFPFRRWIALFVLFHCSAITLYAQEGNKLLLAFHPVFNNSAIHLDDTFYRLKSGDSIKFETLKFYISAIELLSNDKIVWKEENSFHLIDASNEKSLQLLLQTPSNMSATKIKFSLGIDSITNVSGAMGGDLDPTKGMYWTWQSGYINFKLEGTSNLCKTRNNEFQFHLGGYQFPFNAFQTIILNLSPNKNIDIFIDLEMLMNNIDLSVESNILSPCKEAVLLSKKSSGIFRVLQ